MAFGRGMRAYCYAIASLVACCPAYAQIPHASGPQESPSPRLCRTWPSERQYKLRNANISKEIFLAIFSHNIIHINDLNCSRELAAVGTRRALY